MKIKLWQLIWTSLFLIWLIAWAFPMLIMHLDGDIDQLEIYFLIWLQLILIPSLLVYVIGFFWGNRAMSALRAFPLLGPVSWKAFWLVGSIGWATVVGVFVMIVRSPLNPLYSFSWPVAVPIILLVLLLPPVLIYGAGAAMHQS